MEGKPFYEIYEEVKSEFLATLAAEFESNGLGQSEFDKYITTDVFYKSMFFNMDSLLTDIIKQNILHLDDIQKEILEDKHNNFNYIYSLYNKPFSLFNLYLDSSYHMGNELCQITDDLYKKSNKKDTAILMKTFNGIAMRIANEILCLLENGYPHGAVARWRSLYEIWIIGEYIIKHDNEMALKFMMQSNSKKDYEWAKSEIVLPNQRGDYSFGIIEKFVHSQLNAEYWNIVDGSPNYRKWSTEYKTSNKLLHTTNLGVFGYWDERQKSDIVNTGTADIGFLKPALNTIGCLYNINHLFLTLLGTEYGDYASIFLHKLSDEINLSFINADKNIGKQ